MEEPSRWSHWRAIGLLLLIAGGLRAWQLTHTEVASRDSISYIRIAWHLEHDDWRSYLPLSTHHPGYPVAVLGVSYLVRPFLPDDLPRAMQLSAQLASSLAGILLVVPMYYLGRELFDRRVAFWTALLFQCLPAGGRVLGDGLSEGLFLLLAVSSQTLGCQSLRTGSWAGLGLTGLLSALAYLTRPEGAGVALAVGLVLLCLLALRRGSARRCLIGGVSLTVGFLSLALPFMLLIGHITLKNTGHMMLEKVAAVELTSSGVRSSSLLWASWDEARWDHPHSWHLGRLVALPDPGGDLVLRGCGRGLFIRTASLAHSAVRPVLGRGRPAGAGRKSPGASRVSVAKTDRPSLDAGCYLDARPARAAVCRPVVSYPGAVARRSRGLQGSGTLAGGEHRTVRSN
jgi:hypothetical protein